MKRLPRRWWLVPAALAVLALLLVLRPDPLEVDAAVAKVAPMREVVREDGRTRVRDRYTIAAPFAGRLERIALREGDRVAAGDVIARVAPAPLDERARRQAEATAAAAEAAARQAATRVTQAEAALANAQRTLERRRRLAEEGAIAEEELEQFELDVALRQDELNAARAATAAARADAEAARAVLVGAEGGGPAVAVRAPAAGRVLRIPDRSARVVAPGEPLIELGETNAIEVVVPVLSEDAVRIAAGACVELTGWGGPDVLDARVREVEPSGYTEVSALGIEEQRVNVLIDPRELPPALGDNYRVEAAIVVWETDAALQVPASALVRRGNAWTVFVVDDDRVRVRTVEVGHRDGASAEILSGLQADEVVILFPSDRIEEGVRVRARLQ